MEEAWELAALVMTIDKTIDWSARHTRLRYQTVISSLGLLVISALGFSELGLPIFFKVDIEPNYTIVWLGFFLFAMFSLVSFYSQTKLERLTSSSSIEDAIENLSITFGIKEVYAQAKRHEPFEMAHSLFNEIIRSYNDDADISAEYMNELTSNYNSVETVLQEVTADLGNMIFVFRSEAQALFEELSFLSGKAALPWRLAISTALLMERELNVLKSSTSQMLAMAQNSIGDAKTLRASKLDFKLVRHSLDLQGSRVILDQSIERIDELGKAILEDVEINRIAIDKNTNILSYFLPFWLSVALLAGALGISLKNTLYFWKII